MNRNLNRTATAVAIAIAAIALGACNDSYGESESSAVKPSLTESTENTDRAAISEVDLYGLVEQPLLEGALGVSLESMGPAVPSAPREKCARGRLSTSSRDSTGHCPLRPGTAPSSSPISSNPAHSTASAEGT